MGEQVAAGFVKKDPDERFMISLVFTSDQRVKKEKVLLSDG